jgi:hypothetical protein
MDSCAQDFQNEPGYCERTSVNVGHDTAKLLLQTRFFFHYEYTTSEAFQKCKENRFCTSYCTTQNSTFDTRPLCSSVSEQDQKSLLCADAKNYCTLASFSFILYGLATGLFSITCFYPCKLLLSCSLKITAPKKCCDNIVGKIWMCCVFSLLFILILFWIYMDIVTISAYSRLYQSLFAQLVLAGLYPFTIPIIAGICVDLLITSIIYLATMKWKDNIEEMEQINEQAPILAEGPLNLNTTY